MLTDKKAVIFDLDGTIADSMWVWSDIDDVFFAERGIEHPKNFEQDIAGIGFEDLAAYFVQRFQLPDTKEEMMQLWASMAYDRYVHEVAFKPGFLPFLQELKKMGIKTGVATSNSKELLLAFLNSKGIADLFDTVTTCGEVKSSKPAPDVYLYTAEKMSVDPAHCLVFEDLIKGIQAGKNAGMQVCAVYDNYSADEDPVKRTLADFYIHSYQEVLTNSFEVL